MGVFSDIVIHGIDKEFGDNKGYIFPMRATGAPLSALGCPRGVPEDGWGRPRVPRGHTVAHQGVPRVTDIF